MLLDDPLFMALSAALDDMLAPTIVGMDCLQYYLDPALTPEDFLPWLGSFVDADPFYAGDRREEVAAAVPSYALLGTVEGLRIVAARAAGVDVESVTVDEPGKVTWSSELQAVPLRTSEAEADSAEGEPAAAEPSTGGRRRRPAELVVAVRIAAGSHADTETIASVVTSELERVRPVHCVLQVEVTS
jgi:phage tail-like protein